MVYNCENSVLDERDHLTESVVDAIIVQTLAEEVSALRTKVRDAPKPTVPMATSSMTSVTNGLHPVPPVNLDAMRASQQLTARVDNTMSTDAGLLDLHYLTGGKLIKSPGMPHARKITRSVLWPNQFVTRMQALQESGTADMTTLPCRT